MTHRVVGVVLETLFGDRLRCVSCGERGMIICHADPALDNFAVEYKTSPARICCYTGTFRTAEEAVVRWEHFHDDPR